MAITAYRKYLQNIENHYNRVIEKLDAARLQIDVLEDFLKANEGTAEGDAFSLLKIQLEAQIEAFNKALQDFKSWGS